MYTREELIEAIIQEIEIKIPSKLRNIDAKASYTRSLKRIKDNRLSKHMWASRRSTSPKGSKEFDRMIGLMRSKPKLPK